MLLCSIQFTLSVLNGITADIQSHVINQLALQKKCVLVKNQGGLIFGNECEMIYVTKTLKHSNK